MNPVIVFDVDGTISDGQINREGGQGDGRPGIHDLFRVLSTLGYEIHLWSSCGGDHARHVAQVLDLPVAGTHDKPPFFGIYARKSQDYCRTIFGGRLPVLVVDDCSELLVTDVAQLQVQHAYELLHPGMGYADRLS